MVPGAFEGYRAEGRGQGLLPASGIGRIPAAGAGKAGPLHVAEIGVDVVLHKFARHLQRGSSGRPLHRLEVAVFEDPLSNQHRDIRSHGGGDLIGKRFSVFF